MEVGGHSWRWEGIDRGGGSLGAGGKGIDACGSGLGPDGRGLRAGWRSL